MTASPSQKPTAPKRATTATYQKKYEPMARMMPHTTPTTQLVISTRKPLPKSSVRACEPIQKPATKPKSGSRIQEELVAGERDRRPDGDGQDAEQERLDIHERTGLPLMMHEADRVPGARAGAFLPRTQGLGVPR